MVLCVDAVVVAEKTLEEALRSTTNADARGKRDYRIVAWKT